ncbi:MAG: hypothetical protein ACFFB0_07390 [Promethearchaeota archaeon]
MEDVLSLLTAFLSMKDDILEYYNNTYFYLKDLISYKDITLNTSISTESAATIRDTLERMIKAIKTGLNTIGVSMKTLSKTQKDFLNVVNNERERLQNYESYFNLYKELYLNKILFEILIEYLVDIDTKKIETLKLFELLPQNVITGLNDYKAKHLNSKKKKEVLKKADLESLVDFSRISFKNSVKKPTIPAELSSTITEKKIETGLDILTQLRVAKKDNIETLKTPKKELTTPSLTPSEKTFKIIESPDIAPHEQKTSFHLRKTDRNIKTFLDYFGNFPAIQPDLISKFRINTLNIINSRATNPDFLDLECLFFYVSILKMLNIGSPFTSIEVLEIIKNYVNNTVFSSSKNDTPDPPNVFYGLSVVLELNLLKNTKFIDLFNIEQFIKSELDPFVPEKLELNFYSLLCLKLLGKIDLIGDKKEILLSSILNLKLADLEIFNPILDIFYKLTSIKLLDDTVQIKRLAEPYVAELKRNLSSKEIRSNLITTMAKSLLIFDLLELKEQEAVLCSQLLNSIMDTTYFFKLDDINKYFNWRTDKLAYKVELKMLFYTLFACSRYLPLHFEKS